MAAPARQALRLPLHQRLLGALWLLLVCAASAAGEPTFFSFRVESRDAGGIAQRRGLLRNATLPLHGAVKDFG